jgi:hypothetical protein
VRRVILFLLFAVAAAPAVPAQQPLRNVAESARAALQRKDLEGLLRSADRIQLHLPSAQPSGAVGPAQAEAALRTLLGRSDAERVVVSRFREVGGGQGYVELRREFRPVGGGEARQQQVLLRYRRAEQGWVLVEVRVF